MAEDLVVEDRGNAVERRFRI